MRFIPESSPSSGGTRFGHHYLAMFESCPFKWFNRYLRPVVFKGQSYQGIDNRKTATPLLSGGLFHEMLAAWYLSGCKDGEDTGERDVEAAIDTGRVHWNRTKHEYEGGEEAAEEDWLDTSALMREYHDRHGPGGETEEFPDLMVAFDGDGKPLIEREFQLSMGYPKDNPYVYTCRVDLVVERFGFAQVMEHKTSNYRWVTTRIKTIHMDAQFTGEVAVLGLACPSDVLNGVYVNVIAKGRGPRSKVPITTRETTVRTPGVLEAWRKSTVTSLMEIDNRVAGFNEDVAKGTDMEGAAEWHFPLRGLRTGHCWSFNRLCEFAILCERVDVEKEVEDFRPRTVEEKDMEREVNG